MNIFINAKKIIHLFLHSLILSSILFSSTYSMNEDTPLSPIKIEDFNNNISIESDEFTELFNNISEFKQNKDHNNSETPQNNLSPKEKEIIFESNKNDDNEENKAVFNNNFCKWKINKKTVKEKTKKNPPKKNKPIDTQSCSHKKKIVIYKKFKKKENTNVAYNEETDYIRLRLTPSKYVRFIGQ